MSEFKQCTICRITLTVRSFAYKSKKKGTLLARCRSCESAKGKLYYTENRNRILERNKAYNRREKDKRKIYRKKYDEKNRGLINSKKRVRSRLYEKKSCETLDDRYLKQILIKSGFAKAVISSDVIEIKRTIIKIKRLCKRKPNQ